MFDSEALEMAEAEAAAMEELERAAADFILRKGDAGDESCDEEERLHWAAVAYAGEWLRGAAYSDTGRGMTRRKDLPDKAITDIIRHFTPWEVRYIAESLQRYLDAPR